MLTRLKFSRINPSSFLAQFSYLPRILGLIWAGSKAYTAAWIVLLIIQGVLPAISILLIRLLVDRLVDIIGTGATWESARPLLAYGGAVAGIMLLGELLSGVIEWIRTAQAELVQDHISGLVHKKSVSVDLAFYESSAYHDHLERARTDANTRSLALLENSGSLMQNGITLLAMGSLLIPFGLWLPFVLLVSTFPAFFVVVKFSQRFHRWWRQTTPTRRWTQYYEGMLTNSAVAPELRLFSLGDSFRSAFQDLRRKLRNERVRLARHQSFARMGAGLMTMLISGAAMAWLLRRALLGLVSLGDLVLFYQAFNRGQTLMRTLMGNVGQIFANTLFIKDLFEFLELESEIVDPRNPIALPTSLKQGVHFRNVNFRYPGSESFVLRDFDLMIPAGQTVAIVGANGAGKSTLVKLLCRLYDPESGSVEVDGIDISDASVEELRQRISVLFQFPVSYHATVAENIAMGDRRRALDRDEIEAAAKAAGAHEFVTRLPQGYDTLLGKWFSNGVELSGGEWQRIALSRAFVRESPILVLDEPTSFMDSWAEIEWLDRFRALANGRTAIVITHRFTTAMRADVIHVMDDGRIIESGTHAELLARDDSRYARSWKAQMEVSDGNSGARPPASNPPKGSQSAVLGRNSLQHYGPAESNSNPRVNGKVNTP